MVGSTRVSLPHRPVAHIYTAITNNFVFSSSSVSLRNRSPPHATVFHHRRYSAAQLLSPAAPQVMCTAPGVPDYASPPPATACQPSSSSLPSRGPPWSSHRGPATPARLCLHQVDHRVHCELLSVMLTSFQSLPHRSRFFRLRAAGRVATVAAMAAAKPPPSRVVSD
jgi:hypothetical protein